MSYSPMQRAESFLATGELADALAALDEQLSAQAADDEARRLRAAVRRRLGMAQAALEDLLALHAPLADDLAQLSIAYESLGDLAAATTQQQRLVAQQPHDERNAERLVHLYQQQGDWVTALALVSQQPATWRWHDHAGDCHRELGDSAAARAAYAAALAQLPTMRGEFFQAIYAGIEAKLKDLT